MHYSSLESSHQDESNGGCFSFLRSLDAEIFSKTSNSAVMQMQKCRFLTFCQISLHPMIVERCTIAHWNRLIKTNRMVAVSAFYDYWMPRYSTKRQKSASFTFTILRHLTFC